MKKYKIKQRIKNENKEELFIAYDGDISRDVVIKKLDIPFGYDWDKEQMQKVIARFRQEGQMAARLNHPNIVTINKVMKSKDDYFIVMELIEGKTLKKWLKSKRQFKTQEVISIGMQICDALEYAHQEGVSHKEIKLTNIFVNDQLDVKLVDFDISQIGPDTLISSSIENLIDILPTESEQENGSPHIDRDIDIQAVGEILFHLLTGKHPSSISDVEKLKNKLLSTQPAMDKQETPLVFEKLVDIVLRTISKNKPSSFQTAKDCFIALKSIANDTNIISANRHHEVDTTSSVASGLGMTTSFEGIVKNIDFEQTDWIPKPFNKWKRKELNNTNVNETLARLLDVPIFTDPFSGALHIDTRYFLLFWKGHILQIINLKTGNMGDKVFRSLPETASHIVIYTAEDITTVEVPLLLTTILSKEELIHNQLDSEFTDIGAFVKKLLSDSFTGVIRLHFSEGDLYFGYERSTPILFLKSAQLKMTPNEKLMDYLSRQIQPGTFTVDIYAANFSPLHESMRHFFKNALFKVSYKADSRINHKSLLKMKKREILPQTMENLKKTVHIEPVQGEHHQIRLGGVKLNLRDFIYRGFNYCYAEWFLSDLFVTLLSSGNQNSLKYVTTWIPSITTIKVNTLLEDDEGNSHLFDMVMTDKKDKILHLVYRGTSSTVKEISTFLEMAKAVKRKYIKGGDIGGISYVTDSNYTQEALDYFYSETDEKLKGISIASLEAFTGYKGFVRISKNRGFHFNLVTETPSGFKVIAPVL